ncbi:MULTISPECIES: M20 family metallopeptidase [unclassified Caballeronia]|uniref:M20 family metallopeptidase n=1 Tax=unclassified Caballeronia TaxID=2646786 RepID=UPI0028634736|nr:MULTISPECIES: M20 family metallopeptidase [unclassified Caballeronia]MDR5815472.1 M20 family metallopeptidase [Caballeronia sp. LZ033]MDR5822044.1 M20 family metallopeptidase [Caballeronia sp. LZ043]MDR5880200.1 M20 family metallopeptidase [Caballeronia sp. LZ032]
MNFDVRECRTTLAQQLPEMTHTLERLVNIDSGSYCVEGVNRVVDIMEAGLRTLGFTIDRRPMSACADQLVATRTLSGRGRLLILGHADTVWPEGTVAEWPFSIDGDRATGPGVGDMKGGLVMALSSLRYLFAHGFDDLASITFFLVPDEELGSVHSRPAIEAAAQEADFVLVLEPGRPGGGIVTARGALGAFQLCAHGRSAHCAVNYAKGASAIRELAVKVEPLEALSDPEHGAVVNVGMFHGGAARQVVPPEARMDIDLRARTQAQADAMIAEIRRIGAERRNEGVALDLRGGLTRPAFTDAHNGPLRDIALDLAAQLDIPLFEVPPTGGGSDGNFSAALGIPTLDALGPVCENICARDESISLASLAERGALFCGLILQLNNTRKI